jgi:predicted metal-dependent enzyme (double-stranded beta helix superfamily)
MWTLESFVADCRSAIDRSPDHGAIGALMAEAMSDPDAVLAELGVPAAPGLIPIYRSADLTILNLVWPASITVQPHNHEMWALIGIYGGREDNIFWRKIRDDPDGRIEAAGARALSTGDWSPLGRDVIHSVTNPIPRLTGALHVYGGDFFEAERSEWDPENLNEHPFDMARVRALFSDG